MIFFFFACAQALPVFAPSSFYAAPTTRPKRLCKKNLIEYIDTNESDFSCDESSSADEASYDIQDSSSEENEGCSEEDVGDCEPDGNQATGELMLVPAI